MHLIVGLGNPGQEYAGTRHNLGFNVIENIAGRFKAAPSFKARLKSIIYKIKMDADDVILAKPQTFMNLSGIAVTDIIKKYNISLENVVIIHDDLDLDVGRIKLKFGGSSGGHNGLESIISSVGSPDFVRVRVGIGKPKSSDHGADYVLSKIPSSEKKILADSVIRASDASLYTITYGSKKAMNEFNERYSKSS